MSDATPSDQPAQIDRTVTVVSPKYWAKFLIFGLVLVGFGVWGYVDAAYVYPKRGREGALGLERKYLEAVKQTNPADFNRAASVEDPKKFIDDHVAKKASLADPDLSRLEWLQSLDAVKMATRDHTALPRNDFESKPVAGARERLEQLDKLAAEKYQNGFPKALSAFDIPTQWVIMAVGLIGGVWILALLAKVFATKYRWDPAEQRLTLPNGHSIVPTDIVEFDKRKWDKFFVTLKIRDGHPQLSNQLITLDLLRHDPLERWIKEMENTVFPESDVTG
jgi:hypothetical protein